MSERVAWVTGAGGLIGHHIVQAASTFAPGWRVVPVTRERLDLTDFDAVTRAFEADAPSLIVHCAALSRTADCQANPDLATLSNVAVTRHLSGLAGQGTFILFSTDLVFDGHQGHYVESDPTNPLSFYGETKVEAEQVVLKNPRHSVVRVSLNAGISPGRNRSFNDDLRMAWERGDTLKLFRDEFRCPMSVRVTARAIWELAASSRPGLYHLAGSERLSRWEIGSLLARRWTPGRGQIEAVSIRDFAGPPRAADTSLNCAKIQSLLSFPLPGLTRWLADNPLEPV